MFLNIEANKSDYFLIMVDISVKFNITGDREQAIFFEVSESRFRLSGTIC